MSNLPETTNNADSEIWKDVPDYEGIYQVSSLGRVKSLSIKRHRVKGSYVTKERIMKSNKGSSGYLMLGFYKDKNLKTFRVHQLVAITFLGHKPNGYKIIVDHLNNIRTDNRVENLQLTTPRENTTKDKKGCTSKYAGVYFHKQDKRWASAIRINGKKKHLGSFKNEYQAHLSYQEALSNLKIN